MGATQKISKCCSNAYASVDGTNCEAHSDNHSCPANYAARFTPETCPDLNKEIDND